MSSDQCFCSRFLSQIPGIELKTIRILIDNGFDSIHSLLALRVDTDLSEIPDLLLGQKSILRDTLLRFQTEYKQIQTSTKDNTIIRNFLKTYVNEKATENNNKHNPTAVDQKKLAKVSDNNYKKSWTPITKEPKPVASPVRRTSRKLVPKKPYDDDSLILEPEVIIKTGRHCDVCSRGNAGLRHYDNGRVCSPCLSFYRYYDKSGHDLFCNFNNNCVITPKGEQCRSCRWNKCVQIITGELLEDFNQNQTTNGNQNGNQNGSLIPPVDKTLAENQSFDDFIMNNTEFVTSSQPLVQLTPIPINKSKTLITKILPKMCKVCGCDESSTTKVHYNHGVLSCNGCGIYFKRVYLAKRTLPDCINKDNKCIVNELNRNQCKFCRYQACLKAGMKLAAKKDVSFAVEDEQEEEVLDDDEFQTSQNEFDDQIEEEEEEEESIVDVGGDNFAQISCGTSPDSPIKRLRESPIKSSKRIKN